MAIGQTKLDELLKRGKLLKELNAWKQSFDSATKEQIIEWVQNDQLINKGVDGKGQVIGYYSLSTQQITNGRKKAGDKYNLKDTGDFFNSMKVSITNATILIAGNGQKGADNLYDKFGDYITNLTDENIEKLKEIINEKYIEYVKKILLIN